MEKREFDVELNKKHVILWQYFIESRKQYHQNSIVVEGMTFENVPDFIIFE